MAASDPAAIRLGVEERRRALLECGRKLFSLHPYDELSMAMIAKEAGISKALLYHYFPSKQAFFIATMETAAHALAQRVRPDPAAAPRDQLDHALGSWLEWVDANRDAYGKLVRSANGVAEVREIVDGVRDATAGLILDRLLDGTGTVEPGLRAAVSGWLWFMDGVCVDWVHHGDLDRDAVHRLLVESLPGALRAAGEPALADRLN